MGPVVCVTEEVLAKEGVEDPATIPVLEDCGVGDLNLEDDILKSGRDAQITLMDPPSCPVSPGLAISWLSMSRREILIFFNRILQ